MENNNEKKEVESEWLQSHTEIKEGATAVVLFGQR